MSSCRQMFFLDSVAEFFIRYLVLDMQDDWRRCSSITCPLPMFFVWALQCLRDASIQQHVRIAFLSNLGPAQNDSVLRGCGGLSGFGLQKISTSFILYRHRFHYERKSGIGIRERRQEDRSGRYCGTAEGDVINRDWQHPRERLLFAGKLYPWRIYFEKWLI